MDDINDLQMAIMVFVKKWANTQKTPIPQKEIILNIREYGVKSYTILNAIKSLIEKGYIRRAYSEQQSRTFYVQIRNVSVSLDYHFEWKHTKSL